MTREELDRATRAIEKELDTDKQIFKDLKKKVKSRGNREEIADRIVETFEKQKKQLAALQELWAKNFS